MVAADAATGPPLPAPIGAPDASLLPTGGSLGTTRLGKRAVGWSDEAPPSHSPAHATPGAAASLMPPSRATAVPSPSVGPKGSRARAGRKSIALVGQEGLSEEEGASDGSPGAGRGRWGDSPGASSGGGSKAAGFAGSPASASGSPAGALPSPVTADSTLLVLGPGRAARLLSGGYVGDWPLGKGNAFGEKSSRVCQTVSWSPSVYVCVLSRPPTREL